MAKDYAYAIGNFYTVGKDFAFDWMEDNPNASKDQLIKAILDGQRMLPPQIAEQTAKRIANRVFEVIAAESEAPVHWLTKCCEEEIQELKSQRIPRYKL